MSIQRTSLHVSPTPELEQFVTVRIASGRCQTAGEGVRAALRRPEQGGLRDEPARRRVGAGASGGPEAA